MLDSDDLDPVLGGVPFTRSMAAKNGLSGRQLDRPVTYRRLARLVEPRTESFGESWTRLRIIDAGFPRPTPQIWIHDTTGRPIYRLDMGWEAIRTW